MVHHLHTEGAHQGKRAFAFCSAPEPSHWPVWRLCGLARCRRVCCVQIIRDITPTILGRTVKLCNFLDYQDYKACLLTPCCC